MSLRCAKVLMLAAVMCAFATGCATAANGSFTFANGTLMIKTSALRMMVYSGAIVDLKAVATGETYTARPTTQAPSGDVGATVVVDQKSWSTVSRRPTPSTPVRFEMVGDNDGTLVYSSLPGAPAGEELRYYFRLEPDGQVSFKLEYHTIAPGGLVSEVRLPIARLVSRAVIAGTGTRFGRYDSAGMERCVRTANLIYNPAVAVIEGTKGSVGLWPEPVDIGYDDMTVQHQVPFDVVTPSVTIPRGCRDSSAPDPATLQSSWWRIGVFPNWLEVARAYRASYELRTGARPLWLQDPSWVREIHAVTSARPGTNDASQAWGFYHDLSTKFDAAKLLLFYWNGDRIVLFGDHRYIPTIELPTPEEITWLKRWGFNWVGYHPYTLIYSPKGITNRIDYIAQRGWSLPDEYVFEPDYAGDPTGDAFTAYFRPVSAGYYANMDTGADLWVLHPGSSLVQDYLSRNIGDYCSTHRISGCYLDIAGAECGEFFYDYVPSDRRVIDGSDWRRGESQSFSRVKRDNPTLALMSEGQGEWITNLVFYTWEGQTHVTHPEPVRLNHPMRTACWGSYTWTKGDGESLVPLMGCLPNLEPSDEWSVARAKLYMAEDLFHDLPAQWDSQALAYFRASGDRWFQYRQMPWGEAYYEETPHGLNPKLGFFRNCASSSLGQPISIPQWLGYSGGELIGLNSGRMYKFICRPPSTDLPFMITSLPAGAYISGIRHTDTHSVVEFGGITGSGSVGITFNKRCVGVSDADQDVSGTFEAGTSQTFSTSFPGGLVLKWQDPQPGDLSVTSSFMGKTGHIHADGTPYSWWTQNSDITYTLYSLSGATAVPTVVVGPGLSRGYTDRWGTLAPGASPVLRFQLGYALGQPTPAPLAWSVRVNGKEVWREVVQPDASWRDRQVSLAAFAGRTVLVTLSAEETSTADVLPATTDRRAYFGRVRITDNPDPGQ